MTNFFYTDANGQKQGPINDQQLKAMASKGIITPNTPLETDGGHKGVASQIPGLFTAASTPFAQSVSVPTATKLFCTNCGNSISEQAVACMSCGASPAGHKKFCHQCGVGLNPEQVVCIKCGAGIQTQTTNKRQSPPHSSSTAVAVPGTKKRTTAAVLAIALGFVGGQKYYLGSWGWGLVFTLAFFVTLGFSGLAGLVLGILDAIKFFQMSDEEFAEAYPSETEAPFRW